MSEEVINKKEEEFATKLMHYAKYIMAMVVLLVVGGAGAWGYYVYQEKKETAAQEALYVYESQILKTEQEIYENELKELEAAKSKDLPTPDKTPEAFDKNLGEIATQFRNAIMKHKGTRAAAVSAISLADTYSEYGKDEEAKNLLAEVQSSTPSDVLKALLTLQSVALGSADSCQTATSEFDKIIANEDLKFLWPEAYLRKAACAMTQNNMDVADQALDKLNSEFADSMAAQKSQLLKRLKAIKARGGV